MAWIGLDIGGTKIAALAVDDDMQPLASLERPTDISSPDGLAAGAVETARLAAAAANIPLSAVHAIGACVPGQVDAATGTVRLAVNLNLHAPYALGPAISAAAGLPVRLENDGRAASLGALHWARAQGPVNSLAYLTIGTGISAGVILDGELYRGAHGMAGEIGHMPMDPNGPRCNCGMIGCFEAVAAGPAVAAAAAALRKPDDPRLSTGEIYRLAAEGDPIAHYVTRRAGAFLAQGVYLLALAYDVERIIIGGGVTRAGNDFAIPLWSSLKALRDESALAAMMLAPERIAILPADYSAGMWGAVMVGRQTV